MEALHSPIEAPSAGTYLAPRLLKLVPIDDLLTADVAKPSFVVAPLIPRRVVTLLSGHGGVGKSSFALALCAHVACGVPFAGFVPEKCRVLLLSLEDSGDTVRFRLRRIVEAYGLDIEDLKAGLTILDGSAGDATLVIERTESGVRGLQRTALMAELVDAAQSAALIVVDNASDAFDGDENNRRQVRQFMRMLGAIAAENDAGVVLLAHIDKNAARNGGKGQNFSGSTAWHNSARSRLTLMQEPKGKAVVLSQEKLNLGGKAADVHFEFRGEVLWPTASAADAKDTESAAADAEHVLIAIRAAEAARDPVSAARSGSRTTRHVLKQYGKLSKALVSNRDRFFAAVDHLLNTNRIEIEEYRDGNRNRKAKYRTCVAHPPHTPSAAEPTQLTHGRSASVRSVSSTGTEPTNATNAGRTSRRTKRPDHAKSESTPMPLTHASDAA